jgi:hypothetical protein
MAKTTDDAIEQLIATVKAALEDGRASASDLEEWLLAAIMLEEMALEEERDARETRSFANWMLAGTTVH